MSVIQALGSEQYHFQGRRNVMTGNSTDLPGSAEGEETGETLCYLQGMEACSATR